MVPFILYHFLRILRCLLTFFSILLLAIGLLLTAGCSVLTATGIEPLLVLDLFLWKPPVALPTAPLEEGFRAALFNTGTGADGRTIELIEPDLSSGSIAEAIEKAMTAHPSIMAIAGPVSDELLAETLAYTKEHYPTLTAVGPFTTYQESRVWSPQAYFLRADPITEIYGILTFTIRDLHLKRIGVMHLTGTHFSEKGYEQLRTALYTIHQLVPIVYQVPADSYFNQTAFDAFAAADPQAVIIYSIAESHTVKFVSACRSTPALMLVPIMFTSSGYTVMYNSVVPENIPLNFYFTSTNLLPGDEGYELIKMFTREMEAYINSGDSTYASMNKVLKPVEGTLAVAGWLTGKVVEQSMMLPSVVISRDTYQGALFNQRQYVIESSDLIGSFGGSCTAYEQDQLSMCECNQGGHAVNIYKVSYPEMVLPKSNEMPLDSKLQMTFAIPRQYCYATEFVLPTYAQAGILRPPMNNDRWNGVVSSVKLGFTGAAARGQPQVYLGLKVINFSSPVDIENYAANYVLDVTVGPVVEPQMLATALPTTLIINPLTPITQPRIQMRNVVYFTPTLDQQIYLWAKIARIKGVPLKVRLNETLDVKAISAIVHNAAQTHRISIVAGPLLDPADDTSKSDAQEITMCIGISEPLVVTLAAWMARHPQHYIAIVYDEFALFYDSFKNVFANASLDVQKHLLVPTNLPLWSDYSDATADVYPELDRFHDSIKDPDQVTPLALQSWYTALALRQIFWCMVGNVSVTLIACTYRFSSFRAGSIRFGDFEWENDSCDDTFDTHCKNYGATWMDIVSMAQVFNSSTPSAFGKYSVNIVPPPRAYVNVNVVLASTIPSFFALCVVVYLAMYLLCWRLARDNDAAPKDETKPVTIMFTDIQSSTALWAEFPEEMAEAMESHHEIIRHEINTYNGYEVKTIGDSFMIACSSTLIAVQLAVAVQQALYNYSWKTDCFDQFYYQMNALAEEQARTMNNFDSGEFQFSEPKFPGAADNVLTLPEDYKKKWNGLRVRIGIHTGMCDIRFDEVTKGFDYYGDTVNIAARTEATAMGGQILMTKSVWDILSESGGEAGVQSLTIGDAGARVLRGVPMPVQMYEVEAVPGREFDVGAMEDDHSTSSVSEVEDMGSSADYRILSHFKTPIAEMLFKAVCGLLSPYPPKRKVEKLKENLKQWHLPTSVSMRVVAQGDEKVFRVLLLRLVNHRAKVIARRERIADPVSELHSPSSRLRHSSSMGTRGTPCQIGRLFPLSATASQNIFASTRTNLVQQLNSTSNPRLAGVARKIPSCPLTADDHGRRVIQAGSDPLMPDRVGQRVRVTLSSSCDFKPSYGDIAHSPVNVHALLSDKGMRENPPLMFPNSDSGMMVFHTATENVTRSPPPRAETDANFPPFMSCTTGSRSRGPESVAFDSAPTSTTAPSAPETTATLSVHSQLPPALGPLPPIGSPDLSDHIRRGANARDGKQKSNGTRRRTAPQPNSKGEQELRVDADAQSLQHEADEMSGPSSRLSLATGEESLMLTASVQPQSTASLLPCDSLLDTTMQPLSLSPASPTHGAAPDASCRRITDNNDSNILKGSPSHNTPPLPQGESRGVREKCGQHMISVIHFLALVPKEGFQLFFDLLLLLLFFFLVIAIFIFGLWYALQVYLAYLPIFIFIFEKHFSFPYGPQCCVEPPPLLSFVGGLTQFFSLYFIFYIFSVLLPDAFDGAPHSSQIQSPNHPNEIKFPFSFSLDDVEALFPIAPLDKVCSALLLLLLLTSCLCSRYPIVAHGLEPLYLLNLFEIKTENEFPHHPLVEGLKVALSDTNTGADGRPIQLVSPDLSSNSIAEAIEMALKQYPTLLAVIGPVSDEYLGESLAYTSQHAPNLTSIGPYTNYMEARTWSPLVYFLRADPTAEIYAIATYVVMQLHVRRVGVTLFTGSPFGIQGFEELLSALYTIHQLSPIVYASAIYAPFNEEQFAVFASAQPQAIVMYSVSGSHATDFITACRNNKKTENVPIFFTSSGYTSMYQSAVPESVPLNYFFTSTNLLPGDLRFGHGGLFMKEMASFVDKGKSRYQSMDDVLRPIEGTLTVAGWLTGKVLIQMLQLSQDVTDRETFQASLFRQKQYMVDGVDMIGPFGAQCTEYERLQNMMCSCNQGGHLVNIYQVAVPTVTPRDEVVPDGMRAYHPELKWTYSYPRQYCYATETILKTYSQVVILNPPIKSEVFDLLLESIKAGFSRGTQDTREQVHLGLELLNFTGVPSVIDFAKDFLLDIILGPVMEPKEIAKQLIKTLLINPLTMVPTPRIAQFNIIYFLPTLDQQIYLWAKVAKEQRLPFSILLQKSSEVDAITSIANNAAQVYKVAINFQVWSSQLDITRSSGRGVTLCIGIHPKLIQLMPSWLKLNPHHRIAVLYEEFSLYYSAFEVFANESSRIQERLLVATNLPLWNDFTHATAAAYPELAKYHQVVTDPKLMNPLSLQAWYTAEALRQVFWCMVGNVSVTLLECTYRFSSFSTGSIKFGFFNWQSNSCSNSFDIRCKNYGANSIQVLSMARVFKSTTVPPLYGPFDITVSAPPPAMRNNNVILAAAVPFGVVFAVLAGLALYFFCWRQARDNNAAPKDENSPVTIIFTDIQSSTTLWAAHPLEMVEAVDAHHELIRNEINKLRCYEVKTIGDSFMIACSDPMKAVELAVSIQLVLYKHSWGTDCFDQYYYKSTVAEEQSRSENNNNNNNFGSGEFRFTEPKFTPVNDDLVLPEEYKKKWHGLRVRIGIHTGMCEIRFDEVTKGFDYYGDTVNIAARTEATAMGGQILMTKSTWDCVAASSFSATLLQGVMVRDVGLYLLRGVTLPVQLYEVEAVVDRGYANTGLGEENSSSEVDEDDGEDDTINAEVSTRYKNLIAETIYKAISGMLSPCSSKIKIEKIMDILKIWRLSTNIPMRVVKQGEEKVFQELLLRLVNRRAKAIAKREKIFDPSTLSLKGSKMRRGCINAPNTFHTLSTTTLTSSQRAVRPTLVHHLNSGSASQRLPSVHRKSPSSCCPLTTDGQQRRVVIRDSNPTVSGGTAADREGRSGVHSFNNSRTEYSCASFPLRGASPLALSTENVVPFPEEGSPYSSPRRQVDAEPENSFSRPVSRAAGGPSGSDTENNVAQTLRSSLQRSVVISNGGAPTVTLLEPLPPIPTPKLPAPPSLKRETAVSLLSTSTRVEGGEVAVCSSSSRLSTASARKANVVNAASETNQTVPSINTEPVSSLPRHPSAGKNRNPMTPFPNAAPACVPFAFSAHHQQPPTPSAPKPEPPAAPTRLSAAPTPSAEEQEQPGKRNEENEQPTVPSGAPGVPSTPCRSPHPTVSSTCSTNSPASSQGISVSPTTTSTCQPPGSGGQHVCTCSMFLLGEAGLREGYRFFGFTDGENEKSIDVDAWTTIYMHTSLVSASRVLLYFTTVRQRERFLYFVFCVFSQLYFEILMVETSSVEQMRRRRFMYRHNTNRKPKSTQKMNRRIICSGSFSLSPAARVCVGGRVPEHKLGRTHSPPSTLHPLSTVFFLFVFSFSAHYSPVMIAKYNYVAYIFFLCRLDAFYFIVLHCSLQFTFSSSHISIYTPLCSPNTSL
eukprot:gene7401-5212_t